MIIIFINYYRVQYREHNSDLIHIKQCMNPVGIFIANADNFTINVSAFAIIVCILCKLTAERKLLGT